METTKILLILFRVGLVVLAFYVGTKYFLYSKHFEEFAMFAVHSECRDVHPNCSHCRYYSVHHGKCAFMTEEPRNWQFMNPFFTVRRIDKRPHDRKEFEDFKDRFIREDENMRKENE